MLSKILGVIWIILGLWWVIKPEALKNRFKRKMSRKVRWTVFAFVIIFACSMIGSVLKVSGFLSKVVGIIGLVIAIKAIMFITSKTSEKVLEWWGSRSLGFLRIWAVFILVTGVMLVMV